MQPKSLVHRIDAWIETLREQITKNLLTTPRLLRFRLGGELFAVNQHLNRRWAQ